MNELSAEEIHKMRSRRVLSIGVSVLVEQRCPTLLDGTFLVAQMVKHLPTMPEIQVQSLGREDALEQEMATLSSTLAWKIPWMEKPGSPQSMRSKELDTTK